MKRKLIIALTCSIGSQALAQIPCNGYEVAHIIQGDPCTQFPMAVNGRSLSNHNPPWVTGYTACMGNFTAFYELGDGNVELMDFPWPDVFSSFGYSVTDNGWVVGSLTSKTILVRGFIYDVNTRQWTLLEPPQPNGGLVARAANNSGTVVGSRSINGNPDISNAFIWKDGVFTDLGVMNGPNSEAREVSENGIVVGWTGSSSSSLNARGFMRNGQQITVLPPITGGVSSSASGVNSNKVVVGHGIIGTFPGFGNVSQAFVWQNGKMVLLGTLPGFVRSFALDINDSGVIVGEARTTTAGNQWSRAVVWIDGTITNLQDLIPQNSNIVLNVATGVNNAGEILCDADYQNTAVTVVLSPVYRPMGDVTNDCSVDVDDLLVVINEWGKAKSTADINGDQIVDVEDLLIVINNWS